MESQKVAGCETLSMTFPVWLKWLVSTGICVHFLAVIAGDDVEANLAHFRQVADADGEGTYPAEVLVNLLLKLDRVPDALAVAKEHLSGAEDRQLTCPGVSDLARRIGDYNALAEASKAKSDPVNYLAGLIAARK